MPASPVEAVPLNVFAAPSSVYLTGEEALRVTTFGNASGVTLTIDGRVLGLDNVPRPVQFTHAPNSNRTSANTVAALPEGWPLAFTVRATPGTVISGQVWALLELVRGAGSAAVVLQTLAQGFVTASVPLQWPDQINELPLEGSGNLRSITGSVPAAGAEISEVVPTGARWQLLSVQARLTAAGTAGNRQPELILDDGANEVQRGVALANVIASGTVRITWAPGCSMQISQTAVAWLVSLGAELWLGAGFRIRTATVALAAGDQWAAPQLLVREFFDV